VLFVQRDARGLLGTGRDLDFGSFQGYLQLGDGQVGSRALFYLFLLSGLLAGGAFRHGLAFQAARVAMHLGERGVVAPAGARRDAVDVVFLRLLGVGVAGAQARGLGLGRLVLRALRIVHGRIPRGVDHPGLLILLGHDAVPRV